MGSAVYCTLGDAHIFRAGFSSINWKNKKPPKKPKQNTTSHDTGTPKERNQFHTNHPSWLMEFIKLWQMADDNSAFLLFIRGLKMESNSTIK